MSDKVVADCVSQAVIGKPRGAASVQRSNILDPRGE